MEGRTHRFTSFVMVTFFTAMLTYFNHINHGRNYQEFWYIMLGMAISVVMYSQASKWRNKKKVYVKGHKEYDDDSKEVEKMKNKESKYTRNYRVFELIVWVLLLFVMLAAVYTANMIEGDGTNLDADQARSLSKVLSMINIFAISISGGSTPDIDWDWGEKFHRNPILHSYLIPFFIWIYGMIVIPYELRYIMIILNVYCLAYSTHLFIDCIPSTTTGMRNIIKAFFNFKKSPGDVRKIKSEYEHFWMFFSGVICLLAFFFGIPRFYGTNEYSWNQYGGGEIPWNEPGIQIIAYIGAAMLILWLIMFIAFRDFNINRKKK